MGWLRSRCGASTETGARRLGMLCTYEYAGYGSLPAVTFSWFWTNHVESRAGVVTPHFGRQMHCSHPPFSVSFNKRVKTILSSVRLSPLLCARQWSP